MDIGSLALGIDIGSTTVKCVLLSEEHKQPIYQAYLSHETQPAQTLFAMLEEFCNRFPDIKNEKLRVAVTGSGASSINSILHAAFVQEVNAVAIAVDALHPEIKTVFELGGQDAKMILFRDADGPTERPIVVNMNDKCASGTGATLDRCLQKLGLDWQQTQHIQYDNNKLHKVSAKCGVFAETDIVNLLKSSVPQAEVLCSLADAIVMQNLSVLAKGHVLKPGVLLLGGPNYFLPLLVDCWRSRLEDLWVQSGFHSADVNFQLPVQVPEHALLFAAIGAARFALAEKSEPVRIEVEKLKRQYEKSSSRKLISAYAHALFNSTDELKRFKKHYQIPEYNSRLKKRWTTTPLYLGLDCGSTSSKAVLIDVQDNVVAKSYCLSKGNPLADLKDLLKELSNEFIQARVPLDIAGVGVTGYAADVIEAMIKPDINIVETVAHFICSKKYFGEEIDVICDVGGQDIKVIFLKNGEIDSFKLSNQCSAGNGMLLQAAASQVGIELDEVADFAFAAQKLPEFSYGCAVFLDSDRVSFQKDGYTKQELFAGLVQVLPKNIWQYVAQIPRLGACGKKFVLQGGVQKNLAAVKAQVDYIKSRVKDSEVHVHPFSAEAGAIGAAMKAKDAVSQTGRSTFVGLNNVIELQYSTTTDDSTRCYLCDNKCSRTFVDAKDQSGSSVRFISGYGCEKGSSDSKSILKKLLDQRKQVEQDYTNLVNYEADRAFKFKHDFEALADASSLVETEQVSSTFWGYGPVRRRHIRRHFQRSHYAGRGKLKIGIPRLLSIYQTAPFLKTYLTVLGIQPRNIIFSDSISDDCWRSASTYCVNDPCFPAKLGVAHIHQFIHGKQKRFSGIDYIWFPTLTHLPSFVTETMANTCCPVVTGTPAVMRAAFTREQDHFANSAIDYVDDALNMHDRRLLKSQLYATWSKRIGLTRDENDWAVEQALNALTSFEKKLQHQGRRILAQVEKDQELALLFLGRPYHSDTDINHQIMDEFQNLGYPILSIRAIPKDEEYLARFFASDLQTGSIKNVFDINDVWPENFSVNSAQKVWTAKFAARHPNIAVVDISSFKCGHDAPIYGIIDAILSAAKTPHLSLHDLDANKPAGTFKLRIKTFAYTLENYRRRLTGNSVHGGYHRKDKRETLQEVVSR